MFPTHSQSTVPAARAEGHTVRADTQAADAVFVAGQDTYTLSFQRIPNVARPVVVSTKQDTPGNREGNRSDTAEDVIVRERIQLPIGPDIKEPARGIIGTCSESVAVREKS